jgi:hypothetical protein
MWRAWLRSGEFLACRLGAQDAAALPSLPIPATPGMPRMQERQDGGAVLLQTPALPMPGSEEACLHCRCHGDTLQLCSMDADGEDVAHCPDSSRRCSEVPSECAGVRNDACCVR